MKKEKTAFVARLGAFHRKARATLAILIGAGSLTFALETMACGSPGQVCGPAGAPCKLYPAGGYLFCRYTTNYGTHKACELCS